MNSNNTCVRHCHHRNLIPFWHVSRHVINCASIICNQLRCAPLIEKLDRSALNMVFIISYYYNKSFDTNHIFLRRFTAEVVGGGDMSFIVPLLYNNSFQVLLNYVRSFCFIFTKYFALYWMKHLSLFAVKFLF